MNASNESDDGLELVGDRLARLIRKYEELRRLLCEVEDSKRVVALLLELSAHRTEIERLTHDRQSQQSTAAGQRQPQTRPVAGTLDRSRSGHVDRPTRLTAPQLGPAEPGGDLAAGNRSLPPVGAVAFGPTPLVVRFLVEGPTGAGATTIQEQLSDQFRARHFRTTTSTDALAVDWFEFEAGLFEGQPIYFQLIRLSGNPGRRMRRHVRSIVDSVIVVVDSSPGCGNVGRRYVSELLDDHRGIVRPNRPVVTVFANKSDLAGALNADQLAADLLVESSTKVISTNRDQGYLFGFVLATNAAVRRVQRRDSEGLPRTESIEFGTLLEMLEGGLGGGDAGGESVGDARTRTARQSPRPNMALPVPPQRTPDTSDSVRTETSSVLLDGSAGKSAFKSPELVASPHPLAERAHPKSPGGQRRAKALKRLISALRGPDMDAAE